MQYVISFLDTDTGKRGFVFQYRCPRKGLLLGYSLHRGHNVKDDTYPLYDREAATEYTADELPQILKLLEKLRRYDPWIKDVQISVVE